MQVLVHAGTNLYAGVVNLKQSSYELEASAEHNCNAIKFRCSGCESGSCILYALTFLQKSLLHTYMIVTASCCSSQDDC